MMVMVVMVVMMVIMVMVVVVVVVVRGSVEGFFTQITNPQGALSNWKRNGRVSLLVHS